MSIEAHALARRRMARAREAFEEGEYLLGRERPVGAVNRLYYAAFHAAKALLAVKDVDSARHSGVITLFHTHFVRAGLVDQERARALSRSFEKRQKGDYGDFATLSLDEARQVRDEIRVVLAECERVLDRLTARGSEGRDV